MKALILMILVAIPSKMFCQGFIQLPETVSGIVLYTYGKVKVVQGQKNGYTITGSSGVSEAISFSVRNETLSIEKKWFSNLKAADSVVIVITLKEISYLSISGPGTIEVPSKISGNKISINNNGSGRQVLEQLTYNEVDIRLSGKGTIDVRGLNARTLTTSVNGSGQLNVHNSITSVSDVRLSSSGKIKFIGSTPLFTCTINGSGELNALDYKVDSVNINVSGSGNARINADRLQAKISGSGNVYYVGSPSMTLVKSGNGNLVKAK